jgi:hypothetical protein
MVSDTGTLESYAAVCCNSQLDLACGLPSIKESFCKQVPDTGSDSTLAVAGEQPKNNIRYGAVGVICDFLQDKYLNGIRNKCRALGLYAFHFFPGNGDHKESGQTHTMKKR